MYDPTTREWRQETDTERDARIKNADWFSEKNRKRLAAEEWDARDEYLRHNKKEPKREWSPIECKAIIDRIPGSINAIVLT